MTIHEYCIYGLNKKQRSVVAGKKMHNTILKKKTQRNSSNNCAESNQRSLPERKETLASDALSGVDIFKLHFSFYL